MHATEIMNAIQARSHTFMEIDREIVPTVILLLLIEEGFLSVTKENMCMQHWLTTESSLPRKKCG